MIALELALYALCWTGTLLVGGVHPLVQIGLATSGLVLLLAIGAAALREKGLRMPPVGWAMLAAMAWTAISLVPLPHALLVALSSRTAALHAETGAAWSPLSLEPAGTAMELCKQLGYLCVFLGATALLRSRDGTRRAVGALALLGAVVAVSIATHRGLGLTRFFGVYVPKGHPGSGYFAPFVNGNHAASLMSLCALCAFGLAAATTGWKRLAWIACGGAASAALLSTMSRGAAVGLALGGFVLTSVVAGLRFGRARGVVLASILLLALGSGALMLSDGLRGRLLGQGRGGASIVQKQRAWGVALGLAERFPLTGVGRGAFEAPAAALRIETEGIRLNYAENFVLQVIAEWGWPVALALLAAALWTLARAAVQLPIEAEVAGLGAGALAVTVYGLLDCGFEIPGVLLPFTLALGALVARAEAAHRKRRPRIRLGKAALAGGAIAGAFAIVLGARASAHTLDAEMATLGDSLSVHPLSKAEIDQILARHPASAELEMIAGQIALLRQDPQALHHLGRAMRLQPSLPRPHELAAIELLRLGKPAQAAIEYKLAAERGASPSDALLVRYLGKHAVDAVPHTAPAYVNIGVTYASAQRWGDAESAFQRAADLGGSVEARKAKAAAFAQAPVAFRRTMADELVRDAQDGTQLALAIHALVALGDLDRADTVATTGRARFPTSAAVVVEGAKARATRGDLDGARAMLTKTARFDASGRLLLAELAVELARKAGDLDGAAAAEARLRLLRAKVDLEQPSARTPQ